MTMDLIEIESLMKKAIPDAIINIHDLAGDGSSDQIKEYYEGTIN